MIEWLRPAWFLALPAGLALAWLWWRASAGTGPWRGAVDPVLLEALAGRAPAASARCALGLGLAVIVLACLALAGPAWRTQTVALQRDTGARVVVLDLSPSMNAVDVAPSRLERARAAAGALLADAAGAQLGLVVFGADAFSVAPLTADPALLLHLLAGASPRVLPRAGSRPDLGLELARAMLAGSGAAGGEVILVGDSAGDERALAAARALAGAGFPVSVLAVGTAHGGPVRLAEGAFARTAGGEVFVARPDFEGLERVARAGGGSFRLLPAAGPAPRFARGTPEALAARTAAAGMGGVRQDDGAWLALLALPFAALLFRRGWLAGLAVLAFGLAAPAPPALAADWQDLWRRADQQAAQAFAERRAGEEERLLPRLPPGSPWRAMLLYRAERYAEAEALLAELDTADAHYNRGNALALAGRLEAALLAYGEALERRPAMRDALHNRALVREALAKARARGPGDDGAAAAEGAQGRAGAAKPGARAPAAQGDPARDGAHQPQAQERKPEPGDAGGREAAARAELQRLEGLLAKLRDNPGSLLANRFAHQLRRRGNPHEDTGAPW